MLIQGKRIQSYLKKSSIVNWGEDVNWTPVKNFKADISSVNPLSERRTNEG